jgi:hypothetical protein
MAKSLGRRGVKFACSRNGAFFFVRDRRRSAIYRMSPAEWGGRNPREHIGKREGTKMRNATFTGILRFDTEDEARSAWGLRGNHPALPNAGATAPRDSLRPAAEIHSSDSALAPAH